MKAKNAFFVVVLISFFASCSKCKECEITSTSELTRTYPYQVLGVPFTEVETMELCEDQLEAVDGKSFVTDSVFNGLPIKVTRVYDCQ